MQAIVHFSSIKNEIIKNLRKAKQVIKVAVAWITDEDIIRTLAQKAEAGVIVQVVMSDSIENFKNTLQFKYFLKYGGFLNIVSPKFLHHKFCIIDNEILVTGSYNWTYYAQHNEENILVITLDKTLEDDQKLLNAFQVKHKYFCDKISKPISTSNDFDLFSKQGKVAAVYLAELDEAELLSRQELEDDVKKSFEEAKKIGIPISSFLLDRIKLDGGGVEFIKRILQDEMLSGDMKSGYKKLEIPVPHRVDLSLEYLVSRPRYQKLFSQKELEFCVNLMKKYNL